MGDTISKWHEMQEEMSDREIMDAKKQTFIPSNKQYDLVSEEEFDRLIEESPDAITVSLAVETFENEYPELSEEYKRISEEMYEMFAQKHMDYGLNNIALGGDLTNSEDKKFSLTGLCIRLTDKTMFKEKVWKTHLLISLTMVL